MSDDISPDALRVLKWISDHDGFAGFDVGPAMQADLDLTARQVDTCMNELIVAGFVRPLPGNTIN